MLSCLILRIECKVSFDLWVFLPRGMGGALSDDGKMEEVATKELIGHFKPDAPPTRRGQSPH